MRDHRRQRGGNFVEKLIQRFGTGGLSLFVIPDAIRSLALVDRERVLIQSADFKFVILAKAKQICA